MWGLVALLATVAAAAAEPSSLLAPLAFSSYSTVLSPARTTISQQASTVVHPSPLLYPSPITHFIKKRSAAFVAPIFRAPLLTTPLLHSSVYTAPVFRTPLLASPWAYGAPAHFIKKRSATFLSAPLYAGPLFRSPVLAGPIFHTPILSAPIFKTPILAPAHFIKKRSAPLIASSFIAPIVPTSYSSRIDIKHSTPFLRTIATPFAYSSPIAFPRYF